MGGVPILSVSTLSKTPSERRTGERAPGLDGTLTKAQLLELEQREKTRREKILDLLISLLPVLCSAVAVLEYLLVPNRYANSNPQRYLWLLLIPTALYLLRWIAAMAGYLRGNKAKFWKIRYRAPLYGAIFLFLAFFDYVTLKTGMLLYPFIPWVNDIINVVILDYKLLIKSILFTLRLLFLGYFSGVAAGLITGIACGYSAKVQYWISPIIKVLGPIPTATWLPLIMLLFPSLFSGSVFIVGLGAWFAVTVATMTGIMNIDRSYFDAARTLGATDRQLVLKIAIPHAMPNILQGMTQGMSSACVSLMIAEMMGVEAGLGWYITWAKAWAAYNKMFAAIIVICIVFNAVTKCLDLVKRRALRWQTGVVK